MKIFTRIFCFLTASGLFLRTVAAISAPTLPNINTNNVVSILNFGAIGDGVTTNTTAIQNAINSAASGGMVNGAAGGTVEIPAGIFLSGPLTLKSSVNLQLDGGAILRMLPYDKYPGGIVNPQNFISGSSLHDIEISGAGAIDGQGEPWWPGYKTNNRPIMIRWSDCNREAIQNVTLSNSPEFHISISGSKAANTTVRSVTIRAPSSEANPPSHNTDACDVDGTNILVENCNISVGDDDFTCGGGTSGVLLTNNTYGNGHGVSIGSYTDGGVSNITVINCTFNGTDNGIRIKSDDGRGGLVQNISYYNLGMTNVHFPIQIYAYYNEVGTPSSITPTTAATEPIAAVTGETPVFRNIIFSNITATAISGYPAAIIWARTEMPATNILFSHVNISASKPFEIYNAAQVQIADSQITPPAGSSTFLLFNAQVILTNSAPANPVSFDGLTTNGYGNVFTLYNTQASLNNTNVFGDGSLTLGSSTLTIGNNLTLFPSTILNYALGTNAATIAVAGNLTLGGTINVTGGAGFANGAYTLLTYAGKLSGALPTLGSKPAGVAYSFDTNTAGQIKLIAGPSLAPTNLLFQVNGNQLQLSWPADHVGWYLQIQTNYLSEGLGTNWTTVPGSQLTNRIFIPINQNDDDVFLRLVYL
ncbi:MAG: glycoside hydrolase family 28 protein [Limisphaerales bacterium]